LLKLDIFSSFYIGSHIEPESKGFHTLPILGSTLQHRTESRQNEIPSLLTKGNQMQEQTDFTQEGYDEINLFDLNEQAIIELIDVTNDLSYGIGGFVEKLFYSQMITAGAVQFMTKSQIKKIYNRILVQNNVRWVLAENISNGGHFAVIASSIQSELHQIIDSKLDDDEKMDVAIAWADSKEAVRWDQGR
jgi:hypothetical protein